MEPTVRVQFVWTHIYDAGLHVWGASQRKQQNCVPRAQHILEDLQVQ